MADALRIGIAGLGTVGASLVALLQQRKNELAVTCGRAIEIVGMLGDLDEIHDRSSVCSCAWAGR